MGYGTPDIYYQPEEFGLELIGTYSHPDLSWEFEMVIVLRHKETGDLYWAQDSGCSCPSPFEDFTSFADLGPPLTLENFEAFEAAISDIGDYGENEGYDKVNKQQFIQDVRRKLRGE